MIRNAMLLAVLCGFAAAAWSADKTYFKWVDENGVTHYSSHKPHNQDSEQISITTGRSVPSPNAPASDPEGEQGEGAANTSVAANNSSGGDGLKDPERCSAARENLRILQENARVRVKNDDGSFRYLDEAEKAAKMSENRQAIEESC